MSPSVACEKTTCIRQLAIKKFLPYLINGVSEWMATEGTAWHKAFEGVTPEVEDEYYREVLLPDFYEIFSPAKDSFNPPTTWKGDIDWPGLIKDDKIRLFQYTPDHSSWEINLFPGIWMNGKVDKLRDDMLRIEDFKTKSWGGWKDFKTGQHKIKHYPPDRGATIQLNLYRRMVEVVTGVNPKELVIRRMYRGARVAAEAWKKYDIDVWSNDELEANIRPHVDRAVAAFTDLKGIEDRHVSNESDPIPELLAYINQLPLDGHQKHMLNGTKCPLYCTQMPICFELAKMVRFETKPDECRLVHIGDKS
jgi:hypothetical protein